MNQKKLKKLEKELYSIIVNNDKIVVNEIFNLKISFIKVLSILKGYVKNYVKNLVTLIYELVKDKIKKLYNLTDDNFKNLKIEIVNYLSSPFPGTIVLGVYESKRDVYGNLKEGIVYIPYWLICKPKTLIETLVHETIHYIQDIKGKLRPYKINNFEEYFNSPHEKEAREVASKIAKYIFYHHFLRNYYGSSRMYFL